MSATLATNAYHNGFPDLVLAGRHRDDRARAARDGIEVKVTTRPNRVDFDTHGARSGWHLVVGIAVDTTGATPTYIADLWLARLTKGDFQVFPRHTEIGTRTAHVNPSRSREAAGRALLPRCTPLLASGSAC